MKYNPLESFEENVLLSVVTATAIMSEHNNTHVTVTRACR